MPTKTKLTRSAKPAKPTKPAKPAKPAKPVPTVFKLIRAGRTRKLTVRYFNVSVHGSGGGGGFFLGLDEAGRAHGLEYSVDLSASQYHEHTFREVASFIGVPAEAMIQAVRERRAEARRAEEKRRISDLAIQAKQLGFLLVQIPKGLRSHISSPSTPSKSTTGADA